MLDNAYVLGEMARIQLAELRSAAARHALATSATQARRPAREALGRTLIRLGSWLMTTAPESLRA